MSWELFFFYLNRFNAVAILLVLAIFAFFAVRDFLSFNSWNEDFGQPVPYGEPGLAGETPYEGGEIITLAGKVVTYRIESPQESELQVKGANVSLTRMASGKSRSVLPPDSGQLVLNWSIVSRSESEDEPGIAYVALTGTEADYADGRLDLVVGRLSDLEQKTLMERLRFVDSPTMVDDETLSLIVWTGANKAKFLLIDLVSLTIVTEKPVSLPLPQESVQKANTEK